MTAKKGKRTKSTRTALNTHRTGDTKVKSKKRTGTMALAKSRKKTKKSPAKKVVAAKKKATKKASPVKRKKVAVKKVAKKKSAKKAVKKKAAPKKKTSVRRKKKS
jgi:hypothetical protein